ncbi:hypothetical protein Hamer_G016158 [Homarus americanus]|uniref:Uncharacterized protein n=1 Tax=Homarus americanus TaxID=6706 RepID=A0A8J5K4A7_HOMAM|nr:hypothetical protein Hamer_G016158 [Homarus americanus]
MKDFFNNRNCIDFWVAVSQKEAYEMIAGTALQVLVAFHSTYSSERRFSDLLTYQEQKKAEARRDDVVCMHENGSDKKYHPTIQFACCNYPATKITLKVSNAIM